MISLKDIYWSAGFLEGEGCFIKGSGVAAVAAAQVQKEPLERLKKCFGGSMSLQKQGSNPKSSPIWRWQLLGEKGIGLMMTVYPIMSPKRKAKIEKVIKAWKASAIAPGKRTQCPKGHKYDEFNTKYRYSGRRACRACRRISSRLRISKRVKGGSTQAEGLPGLGF